MSCLKGNYTCPLCCTEFQMNQTYGRHVVNKECKVILSERLRISTSVPYRGWVNGWYPPSQKIKHSFHLFQLERLNSKPDENALYAHFLCIYIRAEDLWCLGFKDTDHVMFEVRIIRSCFRARIIIRFFDGFGEK